METKSERREYAVPTERVEILEHGGAHHSRVLGEQMRQAGRQWVQGKHHAPSYQGSADAVVPHRDLLDSG